MAERDDLTAEYVRQILDYNPETGEFAWKERTADMFVSGARSAEWQCRQWNSRLAGKPAGCFRNLGYILISIDNQRYYAHRLAWLYVTGEWPGKHIDHIDGNPSNNRFANIRVATRSENNRNVIKRCTNTSGHKGVYWHNAAGKWCVQINIEGIRLHLGLFDEDKLDDAASAYAKASEKYHGKFSRVA